MPGDGVVGGFMQSGCGLCLLALSSEGFTWGVEGQLT